MRQPWLIGGAVRRHGFFKDAGLKVILSGCFSTWRSTGREGCEEPLKAVEYLNSLRNFEREGVPKGAGTESDAGFDLQRMSNLLHRLGDPLSKYPVVHVAGTKGKGSTVAFLSNILREAGFCVGAYTSPHIQSFRERIVSGATGQPISARAFNQLFDDVHETINEAVIAESGLLTHFEVLTALAFAQFAKEKVDLAVIEAGLGGARDATNVIRAQGLVAAVIVGIGEEHLEALGGSLESIAISKAGIIKDGRPVILGRQAEALAERVVRQVAVSRRAVVQPPPGLHAIYDLKSICADSSNPHQICDISINQAATGDCSSGMSEVWIGNDLKIPMLGFHQLDNAATAIQTALCMRGSGWKVPDLAIRIGVESTVLPGRFQFATPYEALQLGSLCSTVILDGAHTPSSAAALASTLNESFPDKCVAMVVAVAADKDHSGFAMELLEGTKARIIVATKVDIAGSVKRSTLPSSLADSFRRAGQDLHLKVLIGLESKGGKRMLALDETFTESTAVRKGQILILEEADSIHMAISKAAHLIREVNGSKPGVICITGSLHAVSATLSLLASPK